MLYDRNSLSFEVWYTGVDGHATRQAAFKRLFEAEKYILCFHTPDKERWYINECSIDPRTGCVERKRLELSVNS